MIAEQKAADRRRAAEDEPRPRTARRAGHSGRTLQVPWSFRDGFIRSIWSLCLVFLAVYLADYASSARERRNGGKNQRMAVTSVYDELLRASVAAEDAIGFWVVTLYAAEQLILASEDPESSSHPDSLRMWMARVTWADLPRYQLSVTRGTLAGSLAGALPDSVHLALLTLMSSSEEEDLFGEEAYRQFVDHTAALGALVPKYHRHLWGQARSAEGVVEVWQPDTDTLYYNGGLAARRGLVSEWTDEEVQAIVRTPEFRRVVDGLWNFGHDVQEWTRRHCVAVNDALRVIGPVVFEHEWRPRGTASPDRPSSLDVGDIPVTQIDS